MPLPAPRRGLFITFEGIEGSGKSTQLALLGEWLDGRGVSCVRTQEPGGTPLGRGIRALLLAEGAGGMDPLTELLLFNASRRQNLATVIQPALGRGAVVLCDRFSDATAAYQGYGRGLEAGLLAEVDAIATDSTLPDLTLLFDLAPAAGLERARARLRATGTQVSEGRFEAEDLAFHERVRQGYLAIAARAPARVRVIDAAGSAAAVGERVRAAVASFVEKYLGQPAAAGA